MFKVVVDAFGGDNAPKEIVKGAVLAANENADIFITLVGKENEIEELLKENNFTGNNIEILHASEVIDNNEQPTLAIRKKTDSSLVKAFDLIRNGEDYAGFVSAGSTGAVLTGAVLKLGRIKGISRPALCPILPTINGGVVGIIDVGANMDTKPVNLIHFALMGVAYLKNVFGVKNPRVALLNVGVEEKKGNELTKETFGLLQQLEGINFVGNMESRDLLSGKIDLVVCDGFAGNVLLKSTEGAVYNLLKLLKKEIKSSFFSKIGYLFMKKTFKNLKTTLDYSDKGGAVFLGCKNIVVKSHGSSKADSIKASIMQVVEMKKAQVVETIESSLQNVNLDFLNETEN
jgi:glycerol-3-phosphate acyltransferase PlsX